MHVTLVHVHVTPDHVAAFERATIANARASRAELGNLRFDVLRSVEDPSRFVLYEAYVDAAAAADHKETRHYLTWRTRVADWMVEPRVGIRYDDLDPAPPAEIAG